MVGEIVTLPMRLTLRATSLVVRGAARGTEQAATVVLRVVGLVRPRQSAKPAYRPPARAKSRAKASQPRPRRAGTAKPSTRTGRSSRPSSRARRESAPPKAAPPAEEPRDREAEAAPPAPEPAAPQATTSEPAASRATTPERAAPEPAARETEVTTPTSPTPEAAQAPPTPEAAPAHVTEEPTLVRESAEAGAEEGAGPEVNVAEPWEGYHLLTAQDVLARIEQANQAELAAITLYETANRHRNAILSAVEHQLSVESRGSSRN